MALPYFPFGHSQLGGFDAKGQAIVDEMNLLFCGIMGNDPAVEEYVMELLNAKPNSKSTLLLDVCRILLRKHLSTELVYSLFRFCKKCHQSSQVLGALVSLLNEFSIANLEWAESLCSLLVDGKLAVAETLNAGLTALIKQITILPSQNLTLVMQGLLPLFQDVRTVCRPFNGLPTLAKLRVNEVLFNLFQRAHAANLPIDPFLKPVLNCYLHCEEREICRFFEMLLQCTPLDTYISAVLYCRSNVDFKALLMKAVGSENHLKIIFKHAPMAVQEKNKCYL